MANILLFKKSSEDRSFPRTVCWHRDEQNPGAGEAAPSPGGGSRTSGQTSGLAPEGKWEGCSLDSLLSSKWLWGHLSLCRRAASQRGRQGRPVARYSICVILPSPCTLLETPSARETLHVWFYLQTTRAGSPTSKTPCAAAATSGPNSTLCLAAQSCPTLCNPMDCSPPGSSGHGISQARILEWVAISFSRGIFPTQGLKPCLLCLLHYKQILYLLSHRGSHWEPTNEGPQMWGWLLELCFIFPILTSVRSPTWLQNGAKWNETKGIEGKETEVLDSWAGVRIQVQGLVSTLTKGPHHPLTAAPRWGFTEI